MCEASERQEEAGGTPADPAPAPSRPPPASLPQLIFGDLSQSRKRPMKRVRKVLGITKKLQQKQGQVSRAAPSGSRQVGFRVWQATAGGLQGLAEGGLEAPPSVSSLSSVLFTRCLVAFP